MIDERVRVDLTVNGVPRAVDIAPGRTLLDMLRWELDLTGSKECCAEGECGACTVHLNGEPVNACLVLAVETNGAQVTTIEGLGEGGRLSALQDAFLETGAVQCGFCIPGMVMAADALLQENGHPTEPEVREGLSGNLCRCAGYTRICEAVLRVADGAAAEKRTTWGDDGMSSPERARGSFAGGIGRDSVAPGARDGASQQNPGLGSVSRSAASPGSAQSADPGSRGLPASSGSTREPSNRRFDPSSGRTAEPSNRRFDPGSAQSADPGSRGLPASSRRRREP